MCAVELNAQLIARNASVPILRGMEVMAKNSIFVNVASTLIGNLAVYPSASRYIVKRGGCAVIIECMKTNYQSRALLPKLVRCCANLVLTDSKSYDTFNTLNAADLVQQLLQMYPNLKALQKSGVAFVKAMKLRSHKLTQASAKSKTLTDRLDPATVRFLTSGVVMRKFCESAKPRKRIIKLTDDLEYLLMVDPAGKKAPKQLPIRSIVEIRTGCCTFILKRKGIGWKSAKPDRAFALFAKDAQGKNRTLDLETKTVKDFIRWTQALEQVRKEATKKTKLEFKT